MQNANVSAPLPRDILHAAVVSFRPVWGGKAANLKRIIETIEVAARAGVEMILFPEMCLVGISDDAAHTQRSQKMQVAEAEPIPGPATDAIAQVCRRLGIWAIWGMAERDPMDASVAYNVAVVCGPNGLVGAYRKIHPYDDEGLWSRPGNRPFMFDSPWGRVGVGICYDTYQFPELHRYYLAKGCRLYLNPTAACNHYRPEGDNGYETFLRSMVMSEGFFVMSANLVGHEQLNTLHGGNNPGKNSIGPAFGGSSVIIGPGAGVGNMYRTHLYAGGWDVPEPGMYGAVIDLSMAPLGLFNHNAVLGRRDFRPELYAEWYRELAEEQ